MAGTTARSGRNGTVLVVDDDVDLRVALKLLVEDAGYEVLTAPNGVVAIQLAGEHLPDVVLLDMVMPEMDGTAVYAHLRRRAETAVIPVIATTGSADSLLGLPEDDDPRLYYCPKPFDVDRLVLAIDRAVAERQGRSFDREEVGEAFAL